MTEPADAIAMHSFATNRVDPEIVPVFGVTPDDPAGARFAGTAFCFGHPPWLLTAAHVLSPERTYLVARPQEAKDNSPYISYAVEGVHSIPLYDAALLRVPSMSQRREILSLADPVQRNVERGSDVWTMGFPLTEESWNPDSGLLRYSLQSRYLESYVTRVFRDSNQSGRATIEIADVLPPGISGSPIVVRPGTQVIGIAQGTYWCQYAGHSYGYGMATPVFAIHPEILKVAA